MTRPVVEVADILRVRGDCFREQNRSWLGYQQLNVLRAITACRTATLGGHVDACSRCDHHAISYNSCRNRHCPKCQAQARQRWLSRREQDLLSVPYFHVVFTLPHQLNPLCQRYPRLLYDLLFRASAQTMLEVAANPRHLGAKIGFLSILHTWGQNLRLHPHLHCVVPAGGFDPSYSRWVHPKYPFFLPGKVLSRVFRGKFLDLLQRVPRPQLPSLSSTLVHTLLQHDWVVYAKPTFGEPNRVLRYLGRYTHRVAISNQRLLGFDGHSVTFRWRDYAHGNKQRIMTLTATEFLRRFCQHVLPRGFVRIRHFGYLASAHRTALLALARLQLACQPRPDPASLTPSQPPGAAHVAEPTCTLAPTLPRNNWPSDANCPILPDPTTLQSLSNVCQHVFALLCPAGKTTVLSRIPGCMQVAKLPLSHTSTSHRTPDRLPLPDSSRPSPKPSLALSSIATPTTAGDFLLGSLSKMPRSNLLLPQHPAPRHFRSRLTTSRT